MKRIKFDAEGRILSVDAELGDYLPQDSEDNGGKIHLKKSNELEFLKESNEFEQVIDNSSWSLHHESGKLEPLRFSNGKTQEDVVNEVVNLIKNGTKIVLIHGMCGTGKCLDKNTLVFCRPKESLYFGYHKISDIVGKEGEILSLGGEGNIVISKFRNVRKTGQKRLFKLKTRTGREIVVSENHPFLTITSKGISWVPLGKLDDKSYICLPNKINLKNSESCHLQRSKLKILGHLISEGKLGDKGGSPKYYQDKTISPLIRQDYIDSLKEVFPEGDVKGEHKTEVKINFYNKDTRFGTTNKLRMLVQEFGLDGKKSKDKFVPEIIFNLSEKDIAIFLQALFSGDGCVYTRKNETGEQIIIEYDTISKRLIQDVSILLSRLGIQHTITSHKFRENLEYSWRINISNQENVKKYIENAGFLGEKQNLALSILSGCKNHKFTNIDKVPRIIRKYLKNKGHFYGELDRFLNYEKIKELRKNINFKRIIKDKLTDTPCVFKQGSIDFLRSHLKKVNEYLRDDILSFICNEQIFWDKVKSVDFLKEDVTYDLEVPEQNNFIANGIIVHNSAIALNVARLLGRASIVVPVKGLQRQYEEDYMTKKFLKKPNGKKMKIAMLTGRANHDSIIMPGVACDEPALPELIKITEKNYGKIEEYYLENPMIKGKEMPDIRELKRIAIAPANPYWSPIIPASYEPQLRDARKKKYMGLCGKEFNFWHRKEGCSYYDQYQAYIDADVLIFNAAKYKIEVALNRKPATDVEIIDEADEFLDNFSTEESINLTRLANAIKNVKPEDEDAKKAIESIQELIQLEEKNKQALGIDENAIFQIGETKVEQILRLFLKNPWIEAEASLDELNYTNHAIGVARLFDGLFKDAYTTFERKEKDLYCNVVSTNLSKRFRDIIDKNKAIVLMSGTLHSGEVLRKVFGLDDFRVVEAETLHQGSIEIMMTGKEFDCKYANFISKRYSRKDYLMALGACIEKAKKPMLVHVNAFEDLPTEKEILELELRGIVSKERLLAMQAEDKTGKMISLFKAKLSDALFTTKCSRGVDFPGDVCNSVIFTKYPNPNVRGTFWKILEKTHPEYYWDFYKDKARRDFLQRIYRAIRSENDHVYVLSPDLRVLQAARGLQLTKL
jgi:intein/homing endonuclease